MRRITHLIDAKSFESTSGNVGPVYNPATGEQMKKPADRVVKVTIAKALKDVINS